jgi:hypothetical protein
MIAISKTYLVPLGVILDRRNPVSKQLTSIISRGIFHFTNRFFPGFNPLPVQSGENNNRFTLRFIVSKKSVGNVFTRQPTTEKNFCFVCSTTFDRMKRQP